MTKKPHPSIAASEAKMIDAIRSADRFTATLFIGRGQYIGADASTVLGALKKAALLETDERAHTRRAMISAVSKEGHATFLTPALIQRLKDLK
jgi:hypothetical protein